MSGFLDKAKDLADKAEVVVERIEEKIPDSVKEKLGAAKEKAGEFVDKLEEKLPDSVKDKVSAVTDKIKDRIPGGVGDTTVGEAAAGVTADDITIGDVAAGGPDVTP